MSFKEKVVIVTGAGSGIGAATAKLFTKEEATVIIVDKNEETANNTAKICKEFGDKVLVIAADVSKDDEAQKVIETTIKHLGKLDVLISSAGIIRERTLLSGKIMEVYDEIMNANLRSVILMTSVATSHLVKSKGCIVNLSSICSEVVKLSLLSPVYSVSKAGVDSFMKISALELAPLGVRVNAVNPGSVYTKLLSNGGLSDCWDDFAPFSALGKISDPQEIANLIMYLASDKAKSMTGGRYVIDNGMGIK